MTKHRPFASTVRDCRDWPKILTNKGWRDAVGRDGAQLVDEVGHRIWRVWSWWRDIPWRDCETVLRGGHAARSRDPFEFYVNHLQSGVADLRQLAREARKEALGLKVREGAKAYKAALALAAAAEEMVGRFQNLPGGPEQDDSSDSE